MIKKELLINLTLMLASLLISFGLAELYLRSQGHYTENGSFVLDDYGTLRPYHLPVDIVRQNVTDYFTRITETTMIYNPMTGWSPRPNSRSQDGLYDYNSQGIRSAPQEYELTPPAGVLRIALFGDSFTHAAEVRYEHSWGYFLQEELTRLGQPAEVINFGVNGYGMDQAFLRWQDLGQPYQPQVVIFGLQMENVQRNVNLLRAIYHTRTSLPFSKPRFILQQGRLVPINLPALPPAELPTLIAHFADWELVRYEYFYDPLDYQDRLWWRSKVVSLAYDLWVGGEPDERPFSYDPQDEPGQLTLAILTAFEAEVTAQGADFLVVHLPRQHHLEDLVAGEPLSYDELLAEIDRQFTLIRPEQGQLHQAAGLALDPLYMGSHYSPMGNHLVAEAIMEFIPVDDSK